MSSKLRIKMTEDLGIRGLSEGTQYQYLSCVRRYAEHFWLSPHLLGTQHVRRYLLHLRERGLSPASLVVYWAALRFLYVFTLGRAEVFHTIPRPRVPRPPPRTALTQQELRALLDATTTDFDRVFFTTMYATGLRISEATRRCARDIDSRAGLLHVCKGKGDKARSAQLTDRLLQQLREHWQQYKPPGPFLFPARLLLRPRVVDPNRWAAHPVSPGTMGQRFRTLRAKADLRRKVTTHQLRHAYASHLHQQGVDLRVIQVLLGHASPKTTALYTHVSPELIRQCPCPLEFIEP